MLPYNQALISFDNAKDYLRHHQLPKFDKAQQSLVDIKLLTQVFIAYRRLFPKSYRKKLIGKVPHTVKELNNDHSFPEPLVDALQSLFPVNEDVMDEEPEYIYIEQQGLSMSWEEFDELLSGNGVYGYDLQDYAFPVLCWSVGNGVDREIWNDLSETLGWNVSYPERLVSHDVYVDLDVLETELKKVGMDDFFASIRLAWRAGDNYFIDFDPEANNSYPTFTAENICDLAARWKEASVIVDADARAMRRLQADNSLFKTFIECLDRAAKERSNA